MLVVEPPRCNQAISSDEWLAGIIGTVMNPLPVAEPFASATLDPLLNCV